MSPPTSYGCAALGALWKKCWCFNVNQYSNCAWFYMLVYNGEYRLCGVYMVLRTIQTNIFWVIFVLGKYGHMVIRLTLLHFMRSGRCRQNAFFNANRSIWHDRVDNCGWLNYCNRVDKFYGTKMGSSLWMKCIANHHAVFVCSCIAFNYD